VELRPADVTAVNEALDYLHRRADAQLAELDDSSRHESVSSDVSRAGAVHEAAQWIVAELKRVRLDRAALHETRLFSDVTVGG
jgi:hypothetical protein